MLRRLGRTRSLTTSSNARRSTTHATHYIRFKSTTSKSKPSAPASPPPDRSNDSYTRSIRRGVAWAASGFLTYHILVSYVLDYGLCDGISMLPTFNSFGDAVLISKYYRRGRGVKVGDVISYTHPVIPEIRGLKRVVGMEGDFVLRDTPGIAAEGGEEKMLQVPQGHCWIVGDNLSQSRDSRMFGPLPMALIKGKAIRRFDPWWNLLAPVRLEGLQDPKLEDDVD